MSPGPGVSADSIQTFSAEIETFSNVPTMYCGLVGPDGSLRLYDGNLRFVAADGGFDVPAFRAAGVAILPSADPAAPTTAGSLLFSSFTRASTASSPMRWGRR